MPWGDDGTYLPIWGRSPAVLKALEHDRMGEAHPWNAPYSERRENREEREWQMKCVDCDKPTSRISGWQSEDGLLCTPCYDERKRRHSERLAAVDKPVSQMSSRELTDHFTSLTEDELSDFVNSPEMLELREPAWLIAASSFAARNWLNRGKRFDGETGGEIVANNRDYP